MCVHIICMCSCARVHVFYTSEFVVVGLTMVGLVIELKMCVCDNHFMKKFKPMVVGKQCIKQT